VTTVVAEVPSVVASTGFTSHLPLNVPLVPFQVVKRPSKNWV